MTETRKRFAAKPVRFMDAWHAYVLPRKFERMPTVGDTVEVKTKSGKEWSAPVLEVLVACNPTRRGPYDRCYAIVRTR